MCSRAGFLSVDPYLDVKRALRHPQAWTRYAYVENNPINVTDPTGKCGWCETSPEEVMAEINQQAASGNATARAIAHDNKGVEALGLGPLDFVAFGAGLKVAQAGPLPLRFATQAKLKEHFEDHAAEFGVKTAKEYLKAAGELISRSGEKGVATITRPNGDRVIYRFATNDLVVVSRDNVIRTFFKPREGVEKFAQQLFKAVEEYLRRAQ